MGIRARARVDETEGRWDGAVTGSAQGIPISLAIHVGESGFHDRWVAHCDKRGIAYTRVDCHVTDGTEQLRACDGLLWHHGRMNPRDFVAANERLFALEHAGFPVVPDWWTAWHFDEELAQKYLFEAIDAPHVPAWVFLDRAYALAWVEQASFPKVFKLRCGAGSSNVRLVQSRREARRLVHRVFGPGSPNYDGWASVKERWRKVRLGFAPIREVVKGLVRLFHPPAFSRVLGPERGYVIFQGFMPGNGSDTRIIVIDGKAFALKRFDWEGDAHASGSGHFACEREQFDERCVQIAFDVTRRFGSQCTASDFVFDAKDIPLLVEVSYGFVKEVYDPRSGCWDSDLDGHECMMHP